MNGQKRIEYILQEQDGVITTADALKNNISKPVFLEYVKKMGLNKVAHGIYSSDEAWPDVFRQLQMRYPALTFSHESALYLHGVAEREPDPIAVTVKRGYHSSSMEQYSLKIYYMSVQNVELGLMEKESPTGHLVRCYNLERTLCDLLRSQRTVDYQELTNAFKMYVKRRDKNIPLLMRYGETFRVTKKLKAYMEVLL